MRKYSIFLYLIIAVLISIAGCNPINTGTGESAISITDALDRQITFSDVPDRIVIAGRGTIIIVDALLAFPEGQQQLVAYAKTDQGKGSFTEVLLPELDTVFANDASAEEIASHQPDVVFLKTYMQDLGNSLELLSIPVVYFSMETYEEYQNELLTMGTLLGNTQRAEELAAYYADIVSEVEQKTQDIAEKPTVLFLYYSSRDGTVAFNVPPLQWAQSEMVKRAGGNLVWSSIPLENNWTIVNFEQVAAWNPDIIFLTAYFDNVDLVKQQLLDDPQWQILTAVVSGQIYAVPTAFYAWDQPHTRWGIAQLWYAHNINPQNYLEFDFHILANDFYALFYGWSPDKYEQVIRPILKGDID
jgi:iron complex transport system substrate-binding protein